MKKKNKNFSQKTVIQGKPNCPTGSQGKLNHLIGPLLQNITKVQQRNKQRKGSQDYMPQQTYKQNIKKLL